MDLMDEFLVVKFEGDNCGACKAMEPVWKKLEEKNPDFEFVKVNVSEHRNLFEKYDIHAIPTFLTLENGKVKGKVIGITPEKTLQTLIDDLI